MPIEYAGKILEHFGGIGAETILKFSMFDCWFRMASAAFGLIGVFFLILGLNPRRYFNIIPFSGICMLLVGTVLLAYGLILHLPLYPWSGDVGFCIAGGLGILLTAKCYKNDVAPDVS